jgi:tRNA(adenine34) deaminase
MQSDPARIDGEPHRSSMIKRLRRPPLIPALLPALWTWSSCDSLASRSMSTDEPGQRPGPPDSDSALSHMDDESAMGLALAEADAAVGHRDVPVGAVALFDGRVIASRHNERELRGDPTAHAELLVLADAARALGTWRLSDVTVVVTLEPCPMCAGGLVAARVGRVVFGAADPKAGACGSLYNLCADPRLNHEVVVVAGVRAAEALQQLRGFFEGRRSI